jgi:hypothetical protein
MAWISPRPTLRVPMVGKDLDGSAGEAAALTKTAKRRCNGRRHIDIYDIESRDGVVETFYFDITESFGKFSF